MVVKSIQKKTLQHWLLLIVAGSGWGWSISLTKVAAESGYHPMTLMFWQLVLAIAILGAWMFANKIRLPISGSHLIFFCIAGVLGTALPNSLSYFIAPNLSVGVISIVFSLIPMMSFALAVIFRREKFELTRFAGVLLGFVAILFLIVPGFELQATNNRFWIFLLLFSVFCYALESIYAAFNMPEKDHPLTILTGMTIAALVMILPIMLTADISFAVQSFFGSGERALIGATMLHIVCYATFLYLIRHTGPIFASQISYIVTMSGVLWGIIVFSESHSIWTWAALAMAIAGLGLVRQRA